MIVDMTGKMKKTLHYCREVVRERTPFRITQKDVRLLMDGVDFEDGYYSRLLPHRP